MEMEDTADELERARQEAYKASKQICLAYCTRY